MDFGAAKRAKHTIEGMNPKDYFTYLLDHTTIIAEDDPHLTLFKQLHVEGILQLRILPSVGCERFAEHLYNVINTWSLAETEGRVRVVKVEVYEHERNSSSYEG
jgi:6-pyruvoyltetrahydropterin/6-carboxytetrahydropterin synthase